MIIPIITLLGNMINLIKLVHMAMRSLDRMSPLPDVARTDKQYNESSSPCSSSRNVIPPTSSPTSKFPTTLSLTRFLPPSTGIQTPASSRSTPTNKWSVWVWWTVFDALWYSRSIIFGISTTTIVSTKKYFTCLSDSGKCGTWVGWAGTGEPQVLGV